MAHRYAPLNSQQDAQNELEAAFNDPDDDNDDDDNFHQMSESQPLNPLHSSTEHTLAGPSPCVPGTYDFERVDYDVPPPGSPPRPSAIALPNNHGNSNGLVPSSPHSVTPPRRGWFSRTATAILPTHYIHRLGLQPHRPTGAVGGGTNNDGVFANVTAKPTRPVPVQDGDGVYLVPEDTREEAPPSYITASQDAVPPYWETIVHAPSHSDAIGDMIVESLATGSLFSFLWNMLVSISFQFVGFLLTYLLHTTHAARLGSRAGLGVTLIQYGFALRTRVNNGGVPDAGFSNPWIEWEDGAADPKPSFETAAAAEEYYGGLINSTSVDGVVLPQEVTMLADATTEWLSFFLMTVGWFILLTSMLSFWRIKRWERSIVSSQSPSPQPSTEDNVQGVNLLSNMQSAFPGILGGRNGGFLRRGLGLARREPVQDEEADVDRYGEEDHMLPLDPSNPDRTALVAEALAHERGLRRDLAVAGMM